MNHFFLLIFMAVIVSLLPELGQAGQLINHNLRLKLKVALGPYRLATMQRAWPELMDDLSAAIRSGMPIEQAFIEAAGRAPKALVSMMQAALAELRGGLSLSQVIDKLLTNQIDPVGRRLFLALKIAISAGGKDVLISLQVLAENVRRDLQLLDQLRAKQRSAITGARVAVAAPWLVIALTSLQPSVRGAYQSSVGVMLLIGVALVSLMSYLWMLQIAKLNLGDLR